MKSDYKSVDCGFNLESGDQKNSVVLSSTAMYNVSHCMQYLLHIHTGYIEIIRKTKIIILQYADIPLPHDINIYKLLRHKIDTNLIQLTFVWLNIFISDSD